MFDIGNNDCLTFNLLGIYFSYLFLHFVIFLLKDFFNRVSQNLIKKKKNLKFREIL